MERVLALWVGYLCSIGRLNNSVELGNVENPGWSVAIELAGTAFEECAFVPIITNIHGQGYPARAADCCRRVQHTEILLRAGL